MVTLATTLVAIVALVIGVLAVPLRVTVDAEYRDGLTTRWRLGWLWWLVDVGPGRAARDGEEDARVVSPASGHTRRSRRVARMSMAVVRTPGLLQRIGRLLADLSRCATIERLQLRVAFGLDNPADTGVMYGLLSPLVIGARVNGLDVDCQPLFGSTALHGRGGATLRLRPLMLMATVAAFAFSRPVIRAVRAARQFRR